MQKIRHHGRTSDEIGAKRVEFIGFETDNINFDKNRFALFTISMQYQVSM